MDPSMYIPNVPYTPPAGLPQESKLVTYMNRSSSTPVARSLSQAMGGLSLDESAAASKQVREFVPMNYFNPQIMPESPGGSPPSVLATHIGGGLPQGTHMVGGLPQNSHMGGGLPPMGSGLPQGSHMGVGMQQSAHMGGGLQQNAHMGGGLQQSPHMGGGLPQGPHMGSGLQQSALMGVGLQQTAHMGSGLPQASHMGLVQQSPHMQPVSHMGGGIPQGSHMGMQQSSHMGGNMQAAHMPAQPTQVLQENVGGTTYFFPSDSINSSASLNASAEAACLAVGPPILVPSPYTTQMYMPIPTHMHLIPTKPGLAATFYQPEAIRSEIYQRNEAQFISQQDLRSFPGLPETLDIYADLIPLEGVAPHSISSTYRVTHRQTGEYFAMRRLHSFGAACASKRLDLWKQLDHPNIVMLHDHLTSNAFGDHSLVLVYTYHPAAMTLMNQFLVGKGNSASDGTGPFIDPFSSDPDAPRPYSHQKNAMLRSAANLLPEAELWSWILQLTSALRVIHAAGLACRSLDASKVIINGCRVRIAWPGISDALHSNTGDILLAQQDDFIALGRLAMALACRSMHCEHMAALDIITRSYSADFKNVVLFLTTAPAARRSINELMPLIGGRFYTQVEALQRRSDAFEELLAMEIDNGRLFRLLVKLATCNERPEVNCDPMWSETGHCYLLKLFRDYIFHAITPEGRPWIDQAHIVHCLNMLDGGAQDRVPLMSRDEQSILVVSYAELKHCLEASFEEIMQAAAGQ